MLLNYLHIDGSHVGGVMNWSLKEISLGYIKYTGVNSRYPITFPLQIGLLEELKSGQWEEKLI